MTRTSPKLLITALLLSTIGQSHAQACATQWASGAGSTIAAGATVSNNGRNYQCTTGGNSPFCPQAGFEPGVGRAEHWKLAFTDLGACAGTSPTPVVPTPVVVTPGAPTRSPTKKPTPAPTTPQPGCPVQWRIGGTYTGGSLVSNNSKIYSCSTAGFSAFCPLDGFAPGVDRANHWKQAWTEIGGCAGTATPPPTKSPTSSPTLPSVGACPAGFSSSTTYAANALVENGNVSYQCVSTGLSAFCSSVGYEPGVGVAWRNAWTALGSCTGVGTPVAAPTPPAGSCTAAQWVLNGVYKANDYVSNNGKTYQCVANGFSPFCPQAGYEPGVGGGRAEHWKQAWTDKGVCDGAVFPAPAPSPIAAPTLPAGSCTAAQWVLNGDYTSNDYVTNNGKTYQCVTNANRLFCPQAGYEPGVGVAMNWKQAWTDKGVCDGTVFPAIASTPVAATTTGSCSSVAYRANGAYFGGSLVSHNGREYICTQSGYSLYCPLSAFAPGVDPSGTGWSPWTDIGSCGTVVGAPTSSPLAASSSIGGCPSAFSSSASYVANDRVSVASIAYQCKASNPLFCPSPGYEPGTGIAYPYAWTTLGLCAGTLPPTSSPTRSPTPAPTGRPTHPSVGACPAQQYVQPNTYVVGTQVKNNSVAYQCTSLLCQVAGFEPGNGIFWTNAWILLGSCT